MNLLLIFYFVVLNNASAYPDIRHSAWDTRHPVIHRVSKKNCASVIL